MVAGYSGTPLPKKLGIKENCVVAVLDAPKTFAKTLGALPDGVRMQASLAGKTPLDIVVLFVNKRAELARQMKLIRPRMAPACGFWVAWPKKAAKMPTDITEDVVRTVCLPTGLVDNKVCAIDEIWSGLRLVIRLELR